MSGTAKATAQTGSVAALQKRLGDAATWLAHCEVMCALNEQRLVEAREAYDLARDAYKRADRRSFEKFAARLIREQIK